MVLAPALGPATAIAMAAGGIIGSLITFKSAKRLQIDEQYLESRLQGKNWWGGYREEVAEQGYSMPAGTPVTPGIPNNKSNKGARQY